MKVLNKQKQYTNTELIEALKAGQDARSAALRWLYFSTPVNKNVIAFLKQKGCLQEDAEEIFQDGVIALINNIKRGSYDGTKPVENYLFGICKYIYFNRNRKRKIQTEELSVKAEQEAADFETPETHVHYADQRMCAQKILGMIGERCKKILSLKVSGIVMEEVAREMKLGSAQAARVALHRCKQKLYKLIDDYPEYKEVLMS